MGPILSAVGLLVIVLLVLAGAYFFTCWAARNLNGGLITGMGSGRRLEVLDRMGLGKDQNLLVVRAGQRYLLLGSTPSGVSLLAELTQEEGEQWRPSTPSGGAEGKKTPDFLALMQRLREKK